ncbi:hypothetical protein G9A89_015384 [Geosiphon pyriformis]|nr:hypothetical protein G9A89_015384 [Geosiphon pyriformis]
MVNNNKFKVATTPDTATLEYYQSIYTHCKQRFNIPNRIKVVKKSVYQYIKNHINIYLFENYNISEVRSNFYNNLVHYSQLKTEDLNKLNFNIIEYCEKKYPVQSKYSFNFESETKTSNKGKQKVKQYSRTTPNTSILPKTTAKHLQTPEQGTSIKLPLSITPFPISLVQPQTPKPISTSANIIDYLQENKSNHSESLESKETESEPEKITGNEKKMTTAYIAKIPEFTGEDNDTIQKAEDANGWIAKNHLKTGKHSKMLSYNNTSITLCNCFYNIKQKTSKTFIAELKDKLIKKVCPHAPADLATAIKHAKSYEMAMKEANHTKLTNSQKRLKATSQTNNNSNNNHKDINPHNNTTKTILDYHPTTNLKIVIIVEFQNTGNEIVRNYKETNKTGVINITLHHNNLITNLHHQPIIHQDHKIKTQQYQQSLPIQPYQTPPTQQYQVPARRLVQHNQFTPQNQFQSNNNRINPNNQLQRPNHYHTQPSYLTISEKSDFQQPALSEDKVTTPRSNSSNNTILPAQIAQNTNLSDIFPFEFEANESPFLLSNTAANEQRAIIAMYTETTLMQQLQRTVDRPAQTVIVTTDGMKKTPVGEINNFLFIIDKITIPVKVLVMDTPQYQALELKISYQEQYTIVPATCDTFNKQSKKATVFEFEKKKEMPLTKTYMALGSTSNWTEETEQEIFEESRGWKKVRYSTPKPQKQPPYIPLKCKDCNKKLSSMEACISSEEEYETCTCYFCKACHREQFRSSKRSRKWDNTPCLTCGDMLPEECNWIDIAMKGGIYNQTFRRGTPFDAAYNSALNKLYHYSHDAEMIFDLATALINETTQEDVYQMKEAKYIEYTMELAGFDYEDKCPECYALSIPLPKENDENKIEFGVSELVEELPTTSIYLLEKQLPLQFKYFNNHGQGIKPEKAHEIDARYDLKYPGKDTLVLQPKFLTKINLKIALEIPPKAMVQIAFRLLLASKGINVKKRVIDAEYTGDITIMLQNETDKPFRIEHAEKIAQAIYLPLINISRLQSVKNREQLGKSKRKTQGFGSIERFYSSSKHSFQYTE